MRFLRFLIQKRFEVLDDIVDLNDTGPEFEDMYGDGIGTDVGFDGEDEMVGVMSVDETVPDDGFFKERESVKGMITMGVEIVKELD